jgi:Protein of unknown function (DUF1559)
MKSGVRAAISPQILTLTKGALTAMFLTKLKMVLALVLSMGVTGTGATLLSYRAAAGDGQQGGKEAPVVAATTDDKPTAADGDDEEDPQRDVAADRVRSQNNLKQIGLAIIKYHDANGHFPTAAIYSKNDKPLLSWRVAVLPYLDEDALYRAFKRDEPWDSKHNKPLLAQMPSVFAAPGIKTKKPHATFYQVFVGKGALFEGQLEIKLSHVFDGTSNTFLVVEAGKAVPWSKPDDLEFDPDKPLPRLGGVFNNGFHAMVADGSMHFVKQKDEKTLKKWITRAGGEVVYGSDLDP